jgi:hypothetical protein
MKARRENGVIIIEIPEENIEAGVHLVPGSGGARITDREVFFDFITDHFCYLGDNGDFNSCGAMTRMLDELVIHAIENGAGCKC